MFGSSSVYDIIGGVVKVQNRTMLVDVSRHCRNRAVLLKQATRAEHAFCYYHSSRGIRFRQQQGFYVPFYRIADFYLPDHNLIVEIDGG
jgi:very-short-patch-repair endonuclease